MTENIFDLINNFDSFEEAFDEAAEADFADGFEEAAEADFAQNTENGFFEEEENLMGDNGENSFFGEEPFDEDEALGASLGATPWSQVGGTGPFDDYDGDGIPNFRDDWNGPGASNPFALGVSLPTQEQMQNYEEISFTDLFNNFIPDFLPDPISSPQDGSTNFDRFADNFAELFDPTEHYHCQEAPNSCAVAVQTDILNDFGINVSEAELRDLGEDLGVFTESGGTPLEDVGKLLEHFGIEVERGQHFDLEDLMEAKANGEKVIIGLDAAEIWNDPGIQDHPLERMTGGFVDIASAGHAVEFKGVVEDVAGNHYVVLDDPGHPYGHNVRIPLEDFDDAWDDFGHFAAITNTH
jgi:hypothetical protein